ncbi:unnamed protein product [Heterobilharzia americana]|nr:unnamed protein product [Heterobilharzia americana]
MEFIHSKLDNYSFQNNYIEIYQLLMIRFKCLYIKLNKRSLHYTKKTMFISASSLKRLSASPSPSPSSLFNSIQQTLPSAYLPPNFNLFLLLILTNCLNNLSSLFSNSNSQ